jgi:cystathionine beta-lyase/cystathionine gamma-synthase
MEIDASALAGLVPGIFPASVYRCGDPEQAEMVLSGQQHGFAYQRDGHPNAEMLAEKCRLLHEAEWAVMCSTGMAAISVATLSLLQAGQHVVLSDQLYGRTTQLLGTQWTRLGVHMTQVNALDPDAVRAALRPNTQLMIVETLTNPLLRVAPLDRLAEIVQAAGVLLLVDNTFATPVVCQPLRHGADLVVESLSKMMNGHSDVMLGLLCGHGDRLVSMRDTLSVWGMSSSPFDCWLAQRGLATLHLRMERAAANAKHVAHQLAAHVAVQRVVYPGLEDHPDHDSAKRLFMAGMAGSMVTFHLRGGRAAAQRFLAGTREIPFCPSLGEVSTTLSHPASTSHRGLSPGQRHQLGIEDGTIRLSVGTESPDWVWHTLRIGLDTLS